MAVMGNIVKMMNQEMRQKEKQSVTGWEGPSIADHKQYLTVHITLNVKIVSNLNSHQFSDYAIPNH